jgi:hypothetical protein
VLLDPRTEPKRGADLVEHLVRGPSFATPHEEGIDYPLRGVCPQCPFRQSRDRFAEVVPAWGG